ncbi:MAG: NAD(P)H-dependent oxidoreductase [Syntrophales bacterium]|nr:NAD(P)H-dependent oxidoreductase [Syntrophales bacterium]MDD5643107.1 NAD(P)H-dependent oxidoreductase [Syntrophales bacterium]
MAISVILAHPQKGSFNHAIAKMVVQTLDHNGYEVIFHDLYQEKFAPLLPGEEIAAAAALPPLIAQHCREVSRAQGLVIIHPNWWGQPPAVLKGWIDRVFRPGVAYNFQEGDKGEGVPLGLLTAKAALVFNTSNTPPDREAAVFGDPLETIWKNCIFGLCGVANFHRRNFAVVVTSTQEERKIWLQEVRDTVTQYFPKT